MKPSLFPIIGLLAFNCRFLSKELGYERKIKVKQPHQYFGNKYLINKNPYLRFE